MEWWGGLVAGCSSSSKPFSPAFEIRVIYIIVMDGRNTHCDELVES